MRGIHITHCTPVMTAGQQGPCQVPPGCSQAPSLRCRDKAKLSKHAFPQSCSREQALWTMVDPQKAMPDASSPGASCFSSVQSRHHPGCGSGAQNPTGWKLTPYLSLKALGVTSGICGSGDPGFKSPLERVLGRPGTAISFKTRRASRVCHPPHSLGG